MGNTVSLGDELRSLAEDLAAPEQMTMANLQEQLAWWPDRWLRDAEELDLETLNSRVAEIQVRLDTLLAGMSAEDRPAFDRIRARAFRRDGHSPDYSAQHWLQAYLWNEMDRWDHLPTPQAFLAWRER